MLSIRLDETPLRPELEYFLSANHWLDASAKSIESVVPALVDWEDFDRPPDPDCRCYTCRTFTRAYLRHLAVSKEMLGAQLASLHNLHFYLQLMRDMQDAIERGAFATWAAERMRHGNDEVEA